MSRMFSASIFIPLNYAAQSPKLFLHTRNKKSEVFLRNWKEVINKAEKTSFPFSPYTKLRITNGAVNFELK